MKLNLSAKILAVLVVSVLCVFAIAEDHPHLNESSLVWGPYRPNLYFGVRPRIPKTLLIGLMWANMDAHDSIPRSMRYSPERVSGTLTVDSRSPPYM